MEWYTIVPAALVTIIMIIGSWNGGLGLVVALVSWLISWLIQGLID